MKVEASAPSNIALIKYMGKEGANLPANASMSYTLEHLRSFVTIEPHSANANADGWMSLPGLPEMQLSETGRAKFLGHFAKLKGLWNLPGSYMVSSANNFPSDCGLASSASSFAALTLATYDLARRMGVVTEVSREELSKISRMGSGSSCRSLFSPWAIWKGEGAYAVPLNLELEHMVVIVADGKKSVSSSNAHLRVASSLLNNGRALRAQTRLDQLLPALQSSNWSTAFELCWSEFWDMHALFETSQPSFGYMTSGSLQFLNEIRKVWHETGDGPLVTMDAGANIHLLLRSEQKANAEQWVRHWNTLKSWS